MRVQRTRGDVPSRIPNSLAGTGFRPVIQPLFHPFPQPLGACALHPAYPTQPTLPQTYPSCLSIQRRFLSTPSRVCPWLKRRILSKCRISFVILFHSLDKASIMYTSLMFSAIGMSIMLSRLLYWFELFRFRDKAQWLYWGEKLVTYLQYKISLKYSNVCILKFSKKLINFNWNVWFCFKVFI